MAWGQIWQSFPKLLRFMAPPCPTYQLWPFSSAQESHPKMPVRDPQNEFPGIPWIGLFRGISILFNRKPRISRNFPASPWRGFWGSRIAFSGADELDMLGSGDLWRFSPSENRFPIPMTWYRMQIRRYQGKCLARALAARGVLVGLRVQLICDTFSALILRGPPPGDDLQVMSAIHFRHEKGTQT